MSPVGAASEIRTVVLADDHMLVRQALHGILTHIPRTQIIGEANDGLEAIALCKERNPDFLILDSDMPLAKGMEVFVEARRWSPETRICLVTGVTARGHLAEWIAAGVDGIAFKSCPLEDIQTCFSLILEGGSNFTPAVLRIVNSLEERPNITLRERQVLHLLAQGNNNSEIAERLSISPKTVDRHRTSMMSKLGVHSLARLIAYALREGLL